MKTRHLAALLAICLLLTVGCASGPDALAKMTPAEQEFAAKLDTIQVGMTEEQVAEILGPEYYIKLGMRIWYPPDGGGASQARVYFWDDKVTKVRWIKLGAFVYEPPMPKP